jgi:hypothetical protein
LNIVEFDVIFANLLLGFLFLIIGFYILSAILELLSNIFKINISIFDTVFGYFINRNNGEMILQKLVGNVYSVFIEIFLWLIPIACALTAGILMKGFHWVILGAIAGIFIDVILYGTSVILFDIRSSLKNIKNK